MISAIHFLIKVKTLNSNNLSNSRAVMGLIGTLSEILGTKIIDRSHHEFGPSGLTAFSLLQESHIAIHTWPEENFAVIDILSCKGTTEESEKQIEGLVRKTFSVEEVSLEATKIGELPQAKPQTPQPVD